MHRKYWGVPPRKTVGLILLSAGCGMLIVIIVPWWGFFAAAMLVCAGAFLLFCDHG